MNLAARRQIAIRAARSQLRQIGIPRPSAAQALASLDDLARSEPNLIASMWYIEASENQIRLFRREWIQSWI